MDRRNFLIGVGAAGASVLKARSQMRVAGANDRIVMGWLEAGRSPTPPLR